MRISELGPAGDPAGPKRRITCVERRAASAAPLVRCLSMVCCGMPRTGRPKQVLELTDVERDQLVRWERRRKSSQALALRSRIVLQCAEGYSNKDVAVACGVSTPTVGKWRRRFCELRLDGLSDDPRPGRPATITAEQVEQVVVETLESIPENATHWSRAKMAERSGLSKSTIGRIWRAFDLQAPPHRHLQAFHRPVVRGEGL